MIINESKQVGILYRSIDINYIKDTLNNDIYANNGYVSFTRNKDYAKQFGGVNPKLIIDGDKLSNNYKVYPHANLNNHKDEFETRVDGTIRNTKKYLLGIMISKQFKTNKGLQSMLEIAGFSSYSDMIEYFKKFTNNIIEY